MSLAPALLLFMVGSVLLVVGAESLVRGASRLAAAARVSPLVVGLTVVAFGTSSPEFAVTIGSVAQGQTDLALGNVIGSNIFNILLILGASAAVAPLIVDQQLVRLDVPLLIAASFAVVLMGLDGGIGRLDGLLLVAGLSAYTLFLVWQGRRAQRTMPVDHQDGRGAQPPGHGRWRLSLVLVVAGLLLLVVGAQLLVDAAVSIASTLGASSLVIGLTVVAAGTSLPELATSLLASVRGQRDIAVGNAIGSCLFNLLGVLGVAGLMAPDGIGVSAGALTFDLPIMLIVAVATLPVFFTGHRIARWEGAVFVAYYVAYTAYLVLDASQHPALPAFGTAMTWFILPLTVLTLLVLTFRAVRERRSAPPAPVR
ncbi:MAG TPA: calcium/sodium antiporter [Candidatus Limnocylindria bacterium]